MKCPSIEKWIRQRIFDWKLSNYSRRDPNYIGALENVHTEMLFAIGYLLEALSDKQLKELKERIAFEEECG